MYFGHHNGDFIRLAYADNIRGPWNIYTNGSLHLSDTQFTDHIASPDVHVDNEKQEIRMYFHGRANKPFKHQAGNFSQVTDVAISKNGIGFTSCDKVLGNSYFRVWEYDDHYYAIANDGHLYKSTNPTEPFERQQNLFQNNRHFAVRLIHKNVLQIFLSRRGDRPERIMCSVISLEPPDDEWVADPHPPEPVLWPVRPYEGCELPVTKSVSGSADSRQRSLRDPAVLEDDGKYYLFYTIAGEKGIAGGKIDDVN